MSSFFSLELDTTAPEVDIIAPVYTVPDTLTEIIVETSEALADWQDVYIVDAKGQRHDLIFAHQDDQLLGLLDFNICAIGIAVIYAQVRDDVFNLSALVSKPINVRQGAKIKTVASERMRMLLSYASVRAIETGENCRILDASGRSRAVREALRTRQIDTLQDKVVG